MLFRSRYFYFGGKVYDRGPHWFWPLNLLDLWLLKYPNELFLASCFAAGASIGYFVYRYYNSKWARIKDENMQERRASRISKQLDLRSLVGGASARKHSSGNSRFGASLDISQKLKGIGNLMAEDNLKKLISDELKDSYVKLKDVGKKLLKDSFINDGNQNIYTDSSNGIQAFLV